MKQFIKKNIKVFVAVIITTIIVGSVTVYATNLYNANKIKFVPSDANKANGLDVNNLE